MSEKNQIAVDISVLDRKYQLASPADEVDNLKAAAEHLDKQMRELRKRNKSSNGEKLAVVAALNITSELLQMRENTASQSQISDELVAMEAKIRDALTVSDTSSEAISVDN